jgi:pyridoxal phosphate-dependent aminotransferase EpsN
MGEDELRFVQEAFATNWIAPLGPHVDGFEREMAEFIGVEHAVALSSGTAALHLALRLIGVQPGDDVICSSLTFIASASPITYESACPVFIDCDAPTWNMDPGLLREELRAGADRGQLPRAVIAVDLYGQSADYDPIQAACAEFGVPLISDAAESLGATYKGRKNGSFGEFGIFSFNGNKIITTSGGGMLICPDAESARRAKHLATQARDAAAHYQHSEIGFNYRMSNVLAGIGRGQLRALPERIAARKENRARYQKALADLPGIAFMPIADYGEPNYWLTCITIDPEEFGATREDIRLALEEENIESRPVWKPLHLQPVFAQCRSRGGAVSEKLFEHGLCLPSGSTLTRDELATVCEIVRRVPSQTPSQAKS